MSRRPGRTAPVILSVVLLAAAAAPHHAVAYHGPSLHDAPDGWVGTVSLTDTYAYSDPSINVDYTGRLAWTATVQGAGQPIPVTGTSYASHVHTETVQGLGTCVTQGIEEGEIDTVLLEQFILVKQGSGGQRLLKGEEADYTNFLGMSFDFEVFLTVIVTGPFAPGFCEPGVTTSGPYPRTERRTFSGHADAGWAVLQDAQQYADPTQNRTTRTEWDLALDAAITYVASYDWDVNFTTYEGRKCASEAAGEVVNECHTLVAGSASISVASRGGAPAIDKVCLVDSYLAVYKKSQSTAPLGVSYDPAADDQLNFVEFEVTGDNFAGTAVRYPEKICETGSTLLYNRSLWITARNEALTPVKLGALNYGLAFDIYVAGCPAPIRVSLPPGLAVKQSTHMFAGPVTGSIEWC